MSRWPGAGGHTPAWWQRAVAKSAGSHALRWTALDWGCGPFTEQPTLGRRWEVGLGLPCAWAASDRGGCRFIDHPLCSRPSTSGARGALPATSWGGCSYAQCSERKLGLREAK